MERYKNTNICPDCGYENNDKHYTCLVCNLKLYKGQWILLDFIQLNDNYNQKYTNLTIPYSTIYIHLQQKYDFFKNYYIDKDILFCPISQEEIVNPILFNNRHYEKIYIEEWLRNNNTDPMTNLQCKNKEFKKPSYDYNQVLKYRKYYTYKININKIIINFTSKKIKFYNVKDNNFICIKLCDLISFKKSGFIYNFQSLTLEFNIQNTKNIIFLRHNNHNLQLFNIFFNIFNIL